MEWVCADCGRQYHEPPDQCPVCSSDDLVPAGRAGAPRSRGDRGDGGTLAGRLRTLLTDPGGGERGLREDRPAVAALFWLLVALSALVGAALVVSLAASLFL